ncbi:TKL protein kinase [Phytophthora nicotianae CJ01A1]|uniref:TKL protein kinase n=3 Tax=Phytophthora nicotianae TaxID=4792 RepID=W2X599_PHYNI|nr:TKL protein kinase [Phytophthora nicotianae]ETP17553.1 TKL protein kinase [Phytophthora nicotianae CJ01A1]
MLDHPRVVHFVGIAWDSLSDLCIVLEYMEGGDLRALLASYEAQGHDVGFDHTKVTIALHVAHALTYLHSLDPPVLHRDLKSKNVLLTSDLQAKITDFGISRERADKTMTAGVGTSLWMVPEVMMGERYDDKADMFSFGVMLSELDLHTLPYSHAKHNLSSSGHKMPDTTILQRVALGKIRVEFSPGALDSMVALANSCVALDPKYRPTAAEALYHLQTVLREL